MEIQPIGKRNLLIYLSSDEVKSLPAPPLEMKTDDAEVILREALDGRCKYDWENVYLELFAGSDSLLLFARAHSGDPYYFEFRGIEPLIEAAKLSPADIISFLIHCGDKYYLVVYPWDRESPPGVLSEYGEEVSLHPHYSFHLTEHGKLLMGPSALDELKLHF